MKEAFLVAHTDVWQSWASFEVKAIASSLDEAIALAKSDADIVENVKNNDAHIVIDKFDVNFYDSSERVFCTDLDEAWEMITGEDRYKDED